MVVYLLLHYLQDLFLSDNCGLEEAILTSLAGASKADWNIDDAALKTLDNDLQALLDCVKSGDTLHFQTNGKSIKPKTTLTITQKLTILGDTMPTERSSSVFRTPPSNAPLVLTCPDEGTLFDIKTAEFTISNVVIAACTAVDNVVLIKSEDCASAGTNPIITFQEVEFRDHKLSENQLILNATEESCASLILNSTSVKDNVCDGTACAALAAQTEISSSSATGNKGNSSSIENAIFAIGSKGNVNVNQLTGSDNQMRVLYCAEQSTLTIQLSTFESNRHPKGLSVSGGVLAIEANSEVTINSTNFKLNTATNGGAIYLSETLLYMINSTISSGEAEESGGGIYGTSGTYLDIYDSVFSENHALSGSGGSVFMKDDGHLKSFSVRFKTGRAKEAGGSIYAKNIEFIELHDSKVVSNIAPNGGGIYIEGLKYVHLNRSQMTGNEGKEYGGGLYISKIEKGVRFQDCKFSRNHGRGGGCLYQKSSSLNISNSEFIHNLARKSGGCFYLTDSSFTVRDSLFEDNMSKGSGGVFFANHAASGVAVSAQETAYYVINSTFEGNFAFKHGGVVYSKLCSFYIMRCPHIKGNNATENGGAFYIHSSSLVLMKSNILNNKATNANGGAVVANYNSQVVASEVHFLQNEAGDRGGGVNIGLNATLLCLSCRFEKNKAKDGGGLSAISKNERNISILFLDSVFEENIAKDFGGGVDFRLSRSTIEDSTSSTIAFFNTTFIGNIAGYNGAAIFTEAVNSTLLSCDFSPSIIESGFKIEDRAQLHVITPESLCDDWKGNEVHGSLHGGVLGSIANKIAFSTSSMENNKEYIKKDSKLGYKLDLQTGKTFPTVYAIVVDEFDQGPFPAIQEAFNATLTSPDDFFQGVISVQVKMGVGSFAIRNSPFMPQGDYNIAVTPKNEDIKEANLLVSISGCRSLSKSESSEAFCQECDLLHYTTDPSIHGLCIDCPEHAQCDGHFIVPKDGYWHESPCHPNLKKCLNYDACHFDARHGSLQKITHNFDSCNLTQSELEIYGIGQCDKGYEGRLCGSCKEDYGLTLGFKCTDCSKKIKSVVVLLLVVLYLLGLAVLTVHGNLPVNWGGERTTIQQVSSQGPSGLAPADPDAVVFVPMDEKEEDPLHEPLVETLVVQSGPKHGKEQEFEITRYRVMEVFKIIINFLQITAIAATVNVTWTHGVLLFFQIMEFFGALTTSALSKPVDCLANSRSNTVKSAWKMVFKLAMPVAVIACFAIIWGVISLINTQNGYFFWKRFFLSFILILYITYLSVTRLAVGVFNCVKIHDSIDYINDPSNKYWAMDTSIECYEKDHDSLIGLAVLVLVFVTLGLPLLFLISLAYHRADLRRHGCWMFETMGFLYRAYKDDFLYWESFIMIRKIFLAVIVVFSYQMGSQVQGLLAILVLTFCLYFQIFCLPYRREFHSLNHLEAGSLFVTCVTFAFGLFFNSEECSDPVRAFIAALIIIINASYFAFLFYKIAQFWIAHCRVALEVAKGEEVQNVNWFTIVYAYTSMKCKQCCCSKN